jgi:hypothetical protein
MANLNRNQNELLGSQKTLNEKFSLLESWLNNGEITSSQYNFCVNKIINRAMKSVKPSIDVNDKAFYRTDTEAKLQAFLDLLRKQLNRWLESRSNLDARLLPGQLNLFKFYMDEYPYIKSKINRLLIVGLRYPDKEFNKVAEEYVLKMKIYEPINHADYAFWLMLWEDGNLVPLNAIRLMLNKTVDGYDLKPCFKYDARLMKELKPLIEFQRDKEIVRLQWAQSLKDLQKREIEVKRK